MKRSGSGTSVAAVAIPKVPEYVCPGCANRVCYDPCLICVGRRNRPVERTFRNVTVDEGEFGLEAEEEQRRQELLRRGLSKMPPREKPSPEEDEPDED